MKLGLLAATFGSRVRLDMDLIERAESLGFDSVFTAEAYGNDAVTLATWIAARTTTLKVGTAIMQMPGRTPAMTAMTAQTLDALSGGRFILGLGPSGPQVAEGWHGVPYGKPLTRTREYISIVRKVLARKEPLTHHGEHYSIPNKGPGTTGLGKPLKSILHGRADMKIYTASVSPNGLRCAGEVADGVFPLWAAPDKIPEVLLPFIEEGFSKAGGGKSLQDFDICPGVSVIISDDLEKARIPAKMQLALYIGGMGARSKNFYTDYAKRLGYVDEATKIQDLYLDKKRKEAVAAVPDALVDEMNLIGPAERIRDRLGAWREAGRLRHVDTLLVGTGQPEALELLAEELL